MVTLVGVLSTGCSDAPTRSADSAVTSDPGVSFTVPPVSRPLDVGGFRDTPCALMSEQQADDLGLPFAELERSGSRTACAWRASRNDSHPIEALTIRVQSASGLTAIAQRCPSGTGCESWALDTIAGYPVIRANGRLESQYGRCRLFVGVADDVAFLVTDGDLRAAREGADGPRCDRADRAAAFAIGTLKDGR